MGLFDLGGFDLGDWGSPDVGNFGFSNLYNNLPSNANLYSNPVGTFHGMDRDLGNLSEGMYQGAINRQWNPGMPANFTPDYEKAFQDLTAQRWGTTDSWGNNWGANPNDLALRNAEHGAYGQMMAQNPILKFLNYAPTPFKPVFAPAAYTGFKAAARSLPFLNNASMALMGPELGDMVNATPPSFDEAWWGMRPLWGHN